MRYFGFIDDNFLRNPLHLEVLEGLAKLRAGGRRFQIGLMLDVEAACYARGEREERAAGTSSRCAATRGGERLHRLEHPTARSSRCTSR